MYKKGEMGVGTLVVFIAMLLVAAVAAGVLIQTVGSLQERATTTGQGVQAQISTSAEIIEISATDGRNGKLTDFHQRMKLAPGSDPMQLDEVVLTFNTQIETATLQYRGVESECSPGNEDGYSTWSTEMYENVTNETTTLKNDLDDDREDDTMYVEGGSLFINLSSQEEVFEIDEEGQEFTLESNTETFAYVTVESIDTDNNEAHNVTVDPYRKGEGYFSAIYEQTGDNHADGVLQHGDVVRLCFEAPENVGGSDSVRINFVPSAGTPSTAEFNAPDIISTQRVYLYP